MKTGYKRVKAGFLSYSGELYGNEQWECGGEDAGGA